MEQSSRGDARRDTSLTRFGTTHCWNIRLTISRGTLNGSATAANGSPVHPVLISKITYERETSRQYPLESRQAPGMNRGQQRMRRIVDRRVQLIISELWGNHPLKEEDVNSPASSPCDFPFNTTPFFSRSSLLSCLADTKGCPAPEVSGRQSKLYFILTEPWSVALTISSPQLARQNNCFSKHEPSHLKNRTSTCRNSLGVSPLNTRLQHKSTRHLISISRHSPSLASPSSNSR
jgi:hypothetical protein